MKRRGSESESRTYVSGGPAPVVGTNRNADDAIACKEAFPLTRENKVWPGTPFTRGDACFRPAARREYADSVYDKESDLVKFRDCCRFTNMEHGRRHAPLVLNTTAENVMHVFPKRAALRGTACDRYDDYDATEMPYTVAIPSDYGGVRGVPVSFLDRYRPGQFEILGCGGKRGERFLKRVDTSGKHRETTAHRRGKSLKRIFIRKKKQSSRARPAAVGRARA